MNNSNITCRCRNAKEKNEVLPIIDEYRNTQGALIMVLNRIQKTYGYLPKEVLDEISSLMNIPISEVMGVVTFYSFFSTVPKGKYNIMVCMGTACYVKGAEKVLEAFKKELNIDIGETTEDGMFSLCLARCFGACGLAPAVDINGVVHRQITMENVPEIISQYRQKETEEGKSSEDTKTC